jgi:hypothetical protein
MRLLILLLIGSLTACSHVPHIPTMPTVALPVTAPVGAAVLIEDYFEDPACDAQETSVIEMISDVLSAPWNVLWQLVAFEGSVGWTILDSISGKPLNPESRYTDILAWTPARWSGVPPSLDGQRPIVPPACARA